MSTNDNLVPEPQSSIFDSVNKAVGDSKTARQIFANPQLAGTLSETNASSDVAPGSSVSGLTGPDAHEEGGIPIKAVDDSVDRYDLQFPLVDLGFYKMDGLAVDPMPTPSLLIASGIS